MSAATLPAASPKNGRKKLFILAMAVVLLLTGAAAAFLALKSRAAAAYDEEELEIAQPSSRQGGHAPASAAYDPKKPPVFLPLESITFNLADADTDRFAQVTISMEVEDDKAAERVKTYMPIIRSNILLLLSDKFATDMRTEHGKKLLAAELHSQALRPLGHVFEAKELLKHGGEGRPLRLPIKAVHFVSFIVQ